MTLFSKDEDGNKTDAWIWQEIYESLGLDPSLIVTEPPDWWLSTQEGEAVGESEDE